MGYLEKKRNAMLNAIASQPTPPIPSEYQQVEWIGSTGSQYLLINSAPLKADHIETEIACEFAWSDEYLVSGYTWNSGNNRFCMGGYYSQHFHFAFGGVGTNTPPTMATVYDNDFHTWTYENGVFEIVDKSDIVDVNARTYGDDRNRKIQIFKGYSRVLSGKIKYFIQKRNGEEIVNLVPCYRKSDQVIGMYDTVTQTFYTNQGSGTFTKGQDV